jgi:hypothetical protein
MPEAVFGFDVPSIHVVAEQISAVLGIHLYLYESPLMGPWYSSQQLGALERAVRAGDTRTAQEIGCQLANQFIVELSLNDPEPGSRPPEIPGGDDCLLRVRGSAVELQAMERLPLTPGLGCRTLVPRLDGTSESGPALK